MTRSTSSPFWCLSRAARPLAVSLVLLWGFALSGCSDDPSADDGITYDFQYPNDNDLSNGAVSNGTSSNGEASNGTSSNGGSSNGTNSNGTTSNGTTCQCEPGFVCDDSGACVEDVECDEDKPCDAPLICRAGRCEAECVTNGQCGELQICENSRCLDVDCRSDAQCGDGELCVDNTCIVPDCATTADCDDPLTESCEEGVCGADDCSTVFSFAANGTSYASVHVAGSFNGWPPTIAEGGLGMTYLESQDIWYAKTDVPNGRYLYKIVLNETDWITDPGNPEGEGDGFGGMNSVLNVNKPESCGGVVVNPTDTVCGDLDAFDWRDTVMYFLLVDRFYDSDNQVDEVSGVTGGDAATGPSGQYEGGDLAGVQEKLTYLRDLGVTSLWLSAPYDNRDTAGAAINPGADPNTYSGYHGYWPKPANIDFSDMDNPTPRPLVESRIGTEDDLRALVDAAHSIESVNEDGIKVLFDYVMNHVDVESGLYQAHNDWFARRDGNFALCGPDNLWDDPFWGTRCAFTDYLPPFDFDNADARAWSIDDAVWWAKEFNLDGYRLDAIKHVPIPWLTDLRARLNAEFGDPAGDRFYLVGETFAYDDQNLIGRFIDSSTMLDGQFDFPLKARLCEAVFTPGGNMGNFSGWMGSNDNFYGQYDPEGKNAVMTTWIGNHDIPRAIHFASREIGNCREGSSTSNGWTANFNQPSSAEPYERLGVAYAILMTNPGIPLIYYGDEVGLAGGGDPDNRRVMPWDDNALNSFQRGLRNKISILARIRAENKVLGRGRRQVISADQDTWVYKMTGCGDDVPEVIVAINKADDGRTVTMPEGTHVDLFSGSDVEGGQLNLGPRSFAVWRTQSE